MVIFEICHGTTKYTRFAYQSLLWCTEVHDQKRRRQGHKEYDDSCWFRDLPVPHKKGVNGEPMDSEVLSFVIQDAIDGLEFGTDRCRCSDPH